MTEELADRPTQRTEQARVLIVEDENDLADMYAEYLFEYETAVAYGGEEALDALSSEYDVILLDRRMPVISGNEVLAAIEERKLDCRVAMVTAVDPDFDIIDLRIDDYIVKPVTRAELRETVDRLLTLDAYNERMRDLTSKKLKRNVLKLEKTRAELSESEEFDRLQSDISELEAEIDSLAEELDIEDPDGV
ncbi:response regulator [Halovenus carboxidivorans]|uniref:response regulator n=1 Tax=Halovenus carboxidivorans TaxID=2692199 RepID=UPI0034A2F03E